ncbi:MAG: transcription-repair coupling factor [Bacteroidetes bacterium]|nr:transcription-repair coupling factor [Bacteroidota bacterium]
MENFELISLFGNYKEIRNIVKAVSAEKGKLHTLSYLPGSSKTLIALQLKLKFDRIMLLVPSVKDVLETSTEIKLMGVKSPVISISEFNSKKIQETLNNLSSLNGYFLISTYDILLVKLPSKRDFSESLYKFSTGDSISYDKFVALLAGYNYKREKYVEESGFFAQRGAIIDFWSHSESMPVRVEFDGDFIESIRFFDPENQRSVQMVDSATISPELEELSTNDENTFEDDIFDYVTDSLIIADDYYLREASYKEVKISAPDDEVEIDSVSEPVYNEDAFLDEFPEDVEEIDETKKSAKIAFSEIMKKGGNTWLVESGLSIDNSLSLDIAAAPSINSNYALLFKTLTQFSENGYSINIAVENDIQFDRLKDLIYNAKDEFGLMIEDGTIKFTMLPLKEGFFLKSEKVLILSDYQIFGKPFRTKIVNYKRAVKSRRNELASIKPGDFVVHEEYGIGRYAGLHSVKIGDIEQESMKLLFGEGGVVFVNLNYLHLVKKYSSKEGVEPRISILGTNTWENAKTKAKKKIREIARDLIELYARRKSTKGFSFAGDTVWQKELEASFIYEDTPDQIKVTNEIKEDMESVSPMDRLVCGDVGFGKTEVAVRAAFKAVQDNKQVSVLVPTTILAEQHYNTFRDRLNQFPVRVEVMSRFQSKARQKEIVEKLKQGEVDIVIGTHRLISKDIEFKDLGLLIIDEEHRFGVKAKEKLRSMRVNVDTLTLTATPIPRTLNFSLHGARDLSIMATPPANRQPVYTKVDLFDIRKIREWLLSEFARNGQVYIVHDRIMSIHKLGDYIKRFVPEAIIGVAHGRMTPDQLEDVIHGFLQRKFNVLLSTKIIESGIDIPNVNTIIVNRADRFGLAELHQLRGRVGRSDRQAYAFFLVPSLTALKKQTLKRLRAIEEFNELGAGFNLAMRDLEIRGAGNLLGTEQSGFITDVGFDMYMKLVGEAVEELKHTEFKEVFKHLGKSTQRTDPKIDTFFEIGIPEQFMPDQTDRLNFYTSLISAGTLKEIDDIKEELGDRFGLLPVTAKRLVLTARMRYYASWAMFDRVIIQRNRIMLVLPHKDREEFYEYNFKVLLHLVMTKYRDSIKFDQQRDSMKLIIEKTFETPEKVIDYLMDLFQQIMSLYGVKKEETE